MKKILFSFLFPFIIAISVLYYVVFHTKKSTFLFSQQTPPLDTSAFNYITNFNDNVYYENQFLKPENADKTIFLLGSSELAEGGEAIPYNFIPAHFNAQIKSIGHAGNQCFSMYMQLLANTSHLSGAKICFIISPGWFESKTARGTTSEVFLEYNSVRFLKNIVADSCNPFQTYASKRISKMYSEFNTPNIPLKLLHFKHQASKSLVHQVVYNPLIIYNYFLLKKKQEILLQQKYTFIPSINKSNVTLLTFTPINWNSLFNASKNEALKNVTNNNIGVSDAYYTQYIHGKTGHIEPVKAAFNQELSDFKMLVKLAKSKNVNASFIISPLNPFYYENLTALAPLINAVENDIKANEFECLNLFETDTANYEKFILHDVMHLSDYGWYKVDKFMINAYNLTQ